MKPENISQIEERFRRYDSNLDPDVREEIQNGLRKVSDEPKDAIVCIRRALESLLLKIYRQFVGEEPEKSLLQRMLTKKEFRSKLDPRIIGRIELVRIMSNPGAHAGANILPEDVIRVLEDLLVIVEWSGEHLGFKSRPAPDGTNPDAAATSAINSEPMWPHVTYETIYSCAECGKTFRDNYDEALQCCKPESEYGLYCDQDGVPFLDSCPSCNREEGDSAVSDCEVFQCNICDGVHLEEEEVTCPP